MVNTDWAKNEVKLAKKQNPDNVKYYEAAFAAYCKVFEISYNFNLQYPGIAKSIFLQLFNDMPLTSIPGHEDDWTIVDGFDPGSEDEGSSYTIYQCKRRESLFKKVIHATEHDEIVKYSDSKRYICVGINDGQIYTGGIGEMILDEMYPISMPYMPAGKFRVYIDEFKSQNDENEVIITGVLYIRTPEGVMKPVYRYFKQDSKTNDITEIEKNEYLYWRGRSEKK